MVCSVMYVTFVFPMRELTAVRLLVLCRKLTLNQKFKHCTEQYWHKQLHAVRFFMGCPATATFVRKCLLLNHVKNATQRFARTQNVRTAPFLLQCNVPCNPDWVFPHNKLKTIWKQYAVPVTSPAEFQNICARVRTFRARHCASENLHWPPCTYFLHHAVDFTL